MFLFLFMLDIGQFLLYIFLHFFFGFPYLIVIRTSKLFWQLLKNKHTQKKLRTYDFI